jgi:transcriptional regulator with XRE-family HTH domain
MIIGERLRALREEKQLSQGQIEKRSGLLRCYISRVENGHTVPSIETLEKMCRALEVPLYQLFYEGDDLPVPPKTIRKAPSWGTSGTSGEEARLLRQFCNLLSRTDESDRQLLLHMARKMADQKPLS